MVLNVKKTGIYSVIAIAVFGTEIAHVELFKIYHCIKGVILHFSLACTSISHSSLILRLRGLSCVVSAIFGL